MIEHVNLDIADYIRIIILLIGFYFITNAVESGYILYNYIQNKKKFPIDGEEKMLIRKMVILMSPEDRLQIVKEYIEFEKTGILEEGVLRRATEEIDPEQGQFILRAMDIAQEVTLYMVKKMHSLDLED